MLKRSHLLARLLLCDLRQTVSEMRQTKDMAAPQLAEALAQMAERLEGAVQVEVRVDPAAAQIERKTGEALLQAAREGVTKALRHAGARRVSVLWEQLENHWFLTITDNGRAVAPVEPGNGRKGIQERSRETGGRTPHRPSSAD